MTAPRTGTVAADGAVIAYDVHDRGFGDGTPLMLIGSPMTAAGFGALVAEIPDRPVITYDPRGCGRSTKADPGSFNTPEQHAADLQRVVEAVGVDRVDLFASSGGAVNALAWVVAGGPLGTVVAHEPPLYAVLPDRRYATAVGQRMSDTYDRAGFGPAMAQFMVLVMHRGPFTEADLAAPVPDPAMFGLPTGDSGDRTDPLLWQNRPCTAWQPDLAALRGTSARLVLALGTESPEFVTGRATLALAEQLGLQPSWFPGGHIGFMGDNGSCGGGSMPDDATDTAGDPAAFAARLREVLDDSVVRTPSGDPG